MDDLLDTLTQHLIGLAASTGFDIQNAKQLAYAYGLGSLWELIRDVYLNAYIAGPLFLALAWLWPAERSARPHKRASIAIDLIYPILCLPISATIVAATVAGINWLVETYTPTLALGLLDDKPILVQALGAFLISDLMFYVAHVLKHKVRGLWHFHAVHHSQRYVNALSTFRNHPFEAIINAVIKTVPIAIIGGTYPGWALFALVNNMWVFFIHADLRTNLGPLKWVLVTPQNHRFHHTIEPSLADRNFGERLTVWDWMFGTLHTGFDDYTETGVKGCEEIEERSASPVGMLAAFVRQFLFPFRMIGQDVRRYLQVRRALRA